MAAAPGADVTPGSGPGHPPGLDVAARRRFLAALTAAVVVASLPFVRGVLAGRVLYFRDLSVLFYPHRQYVVEGLRAGDLYYWDPYVHEGVPLLYPPLSYPLDTLQALWPDVRWYSLLLALHVPLAAVAFATLARRLGLSAVAIAGGAAAYALGGFVLSTVNLYLYVQAAAWAPLVVLGLRAAATRDWRATSWASIATAVALSTLGVEVALQAILIGLVLALRLRRPATLLRPLAAVALGGGLAAPAILVMRGTMAAGERAHGFSTDVVLNQSVHPFTLLQVVVANLYGDLAGGPDRWWGSNFFDRGFPYILSLYLGATALALAAAGAWTDKRRGRLVGLTLAALVVALGRWGGLETLVGALPDSLRMLRYPTKAYFTVHFCVALLAAMGLHGLSRRRGWRVLLLLLAGPGLVLVLAPVLPFAFPRGAAWFVSHFFPPTMGAAARAANFADMLADAARGGLLATAAAVVAAVVLAQRLTPRLGAGLVAAIAVADLLRAGAGLNPMEDPAWLRPAPEVVTTLRALPGLQRVYSCRPEWSRAYWAARSQRPRQHEALTLAAWADTLTPHFNRSVHVASALSEDLTSLVPLSRLLPRGVDCADMSQLLPRLRAAGVSHVLSLDPLEDGGLRSVAEVAPPRLGPLHVFVYAVRDPVPLRFVAASVHAAPAPHDPVSAGETVWLDAPPEQFDGVSGSVRSIRETPDHLELAVRASRSTALVVLDGSFPGWRATLDGHRVPILAVGQHRAVWVPAGDSIVRMDYRPPGLRGGLVLMAASCGVLLCALRGRLRDTRRERIGASPASAA